MTRPAAAASTGAPKSARISMPRCQLLRRRPKVDVTGPSTGQAKGGMGSEGKGGKKGHIRPGSGWLGDNAFDTPRLTWQMALRSLDNGGPIVDTGYEGEKSVAKPEWGTKRICPSCGCKFYDMQHTPCVCPKCETKFDPAQALRGSRKAAAVGRAMSG